MFQQVLMAPSHRLPSRPSRNTPRRNTSSSSDPCDKTLIDGQPCIAKVHLPKAPLPVQEAPAQERPSPTTKPANPANPECSPEKGAVQPSTKDNKAIISPTKEQSPPVSPDATDEPMEVSPSQPSGGEETQGVTAPDRTPMDPQPASGSRKSLVETSGSPGSSVADEEEMDTTPESIPNPGQSSEEKPPEPLGEIPTSPALSSPLAPGTSPKEPPQAHSLLSPGDHSSVSPTTTTLIPFIPKIGMGKPAITKRKFSPGRPRVKQPPNFLPSSYPNQPEGWDFPKTRQPPGSPGWSIRVGRGSGFPGRRRPRGAGLSGRGGRGRARGKNGASPSIHPGLTMESQYPVKEEEENTMHNTVVIFSSNDSFTLKQDMCVVCGSFGLGAEGRLLACAQCGQCYHPFCVGIKITKVVLSKGWRCLECSVCEACGQATDPGRLLLCDDCDISYHTYCLDPPLQNVPKDSWKCKW
ncbi:hypothetical protein CRUP_035784 [Coryphaenoides rupestris]|nr:hypothetical protein CRUP_035784 [Coryphaenoides rupestris]